VGIILQVFLSGYKSDPLEHLHPESLPGDGSDHVACVPLSSDEVPPDKQDVSPLVDVMIVLHSP